MLAQPVGRRRIAPILTGHGRGVEGAHLLEQTGVIDVVNRRRRRLAPGQGQQPRPAVAAEFEVYKKVVAAQKLTLE